jgi:DNA invertase Pin-like site-specific DNA recombinase
MGKAKMPLAFSYLRFSTREQAAGDSLARQIEKTADWCKRHKAQLDQSITLRDEGVSAFRGRHRESPDMNALAAFLAAVKSGRVPRGSFLIVESLDRLTREQIRPALTLLLNLIDAGIRVVQLMPTEATYDENVEPMALMQAIMELNRGHSESKVKSERVLAAWARKRREAGSRIISRRLPGWIKCEDGKLVLDPAGAETIRRIFALLRDGHGVPAIAKKLNESRVPVLGRTVYKGQRVLWSRSVVYHILTSRTLIGEYQPQRGRGAERQAAGEPIKGYYPAVIEEDAFHAAQATLRTRATVARGRRGKHINLFAGLLKDARDGGSITYANQRRRSPFLVPVGAVTGRGAKWTMYPVEPFETATINELVKFADINPDNDAALRVQALAGRKAEVENLIKLWTAKMENPAIVDTVAAKLAELHARLKAIGEEQAEAQREAASPLAEAWGEFRSLAELLAADKSDELRLKVRAALRRSVESVNCLFTGRQMDRLAAVQVWFRDGKTHREFIIRYIPPNKSAKREAKLSVGTLKNLDGIDLREPKEAAAVEQRLLKLDLAKVPALAS